MSALGRYAAQAVVYGLIAWALAVFANGPAYVHFPPDKAQIKMNFSHGAMRAKACRRLSREELAALAPNMRKPFDCSRGRLPVTIELILDGDTVYGATLKPGGLFGDGPVTVYQLFAVAPGHHQITARLRDSDRADGFDYETDVAFKLRPGQNFVIDFRAREGGFTFE